MMTFGKSIVVNTLYRLGNVLVNFLTTIVIARLIDVNGYGFLSLMIANAAVFNLITSLGSDSSISYYSATSKISFGKITGLFWLIIALQVIVFFAGEFVLFNNTGNTWM